MPGIAKDPEVRARQISYLRPNGRPKGVPNKNTSEIKAMILRALDKVGGVEYFAVQAEKNPSAFLALVGRIMPAPKPEGANVNVNVGLICSEEQRQKLIELRERILLNGKRPTNDAESHTEAALLE
jgi:hypothetical protein